jgi:YggT family protein
MYILIQIINIVYWILVILLWARVIFSWVRPDPYNPTWGPIVRFIYQVTEPLLAPIRRLLPGMSGLDLSPMILWFILYLAHNFIIRALI